MARKVFFSFHYKDVASFRTNAVRNSWVTKRSTTDFIFYDSSLWEQVKKESPIAIKRMINSGLKNTSVTAILTGSETYARPWVRYEILESFKRSNGLITIHINSIPAKNKLTSAKGPDPLDYFYFRIENAKIHLWEWDVVSENWRFIESINKSDVNYKFGNISEGKFSIIFGSCDWMIDDGYNKFSDWIERVAVFAGK
ncbi:TIR domain-containing protein [Paenibacillus polymyxa]|uniref:TIR domain-containing protein n=1 Tax=Paenibacillus polymyxa TaxID=1406 RepID=UPI002025806D|nr:TIR domain-containing protein [Paenibacillus polymyxa]MDU8672537.1 TIR domain-containing protein [Paenibacillus polymyxa]MDU8697444.1 TIR domain-containing protein [Paenibacillus polymyxa]URJ56609.1 TIR domain-containing protein [Paenibacillus polymyxa]URJ64039.1 TIR domain-containing protein [Paenibacillus polymyxa]URJ71117.1 TIR domain-containing protein [Paenibacillus polymyxa]